MIKTDLITLKENVNHGDFMLPFTIYTGDLSNVNEDINIHWHEEMEIIFVDDGIGNFMVDLHSYKIKKGDLILIHPHTLHSVTHIPGKNMRWRSTVFDINMLKSYSTDGTLIKYLAPLINKEHTLPTIITKDLLCYNELTYIFNESLNCFINKEDGFELELKSLLFKCISILYRNNLIKKVEVSNNLSSSTIDKIKLVLNYINSNYSSEVKISDLSFLCDFSEYYFMRFFKKHVGMSAIQYLNTYRLEKACFLLNNTEMSIMDISLEVGFESLSYFIKLFKRKYEVTPLEFRKIKK